jgi:hypothetical protein
MKDLKLDFNRPYFGLSIELVSDMSKRKINKIFRSVDESYKFPIFNKFNVTERAIRQIRPLYINDGLEYWLTLEDKISIIINNY